jgi:hypothetical protein
MTTNRPVLDETEFSYEYLQSILDPSVPLYAQLRRIPQGCPPWKAIAALDPVYREYTETRTRLELRYKELLKKARRQKQIANPKCYNARGKQIAYPYKRNSRLCALVIQLRLTREELNSNEIKYHGHRWYAPSS